MNSEAFYATNERGERVNNDGYTDRDVLRQTVFGAITIVVLCLFVYLFA